MIYLKFLIENIRHYFKSSILVFILIALLSFIFSLTSYLYNGVLSVTSKSARSKGDIIVDINFDAQDVDHKAFSFEEKKALYNDWSSLVNNTWESKEVKEGYSIPSEIISNGTSKNLEITSFSLKNSQYLISIEQGRSPGSNEILLPDTLKGQVNIGEGITVIYKDQDKIVNSLILTVSGFFVENEELENIALVTVDQMDLMDSFRLPNMMYIYIEEENANYPILTQEQKDFYWNSIEEKLLPYFKDVNFLKKNVSFWTSLDEYNQSKTFIDLFLIIIMIFLSALGIIASFSISNVNHMNILERLKVIGTLFSFGLKKKHGALLLALETCGVAFLSTLIGVLFSIGAGKYIEGIHLMSNSRTLSAFLGGKSTLTLLYLPSSFTLTFIVCVGFPFLISLITILKILRGTIVNQIRSNF